MDEELRAMESFHTWSSGPLLEGKKQLIIKHEENGSVDSYEARLVGKGFTQLEGIDYTETFFQLDINNDFLNGICNVEVYMKLPPSYGSDQQGMVCRLYKSINGLK
ncbi:Retrovirus-related Pol polyprotein from transposon TNT 1-94 [Gossypium australe]|uniref:Retrovirus-related Pol polyprotein from transposon TNT 1-94 n=1 Tax=Gossypium australe TaxID=47621 RepID=A0A5B6W7H8_9ROSI|nr:Retrovirus-related Pol polyprotein from transposon TNT 1-94 [Gossypium australe]